MLAQTRQSSSSSSMDDFELPPRPEEHFAAFDNQITKPPLGPPITMKQEEVDTVVRYLESKMRAGEEDQDLDFTAIVFARTPAQHFTHNRTAEYAQMLLNRVLHIRNDADEFVLICNLLSKDGSTRFLAQNAKCVELFGDLVKDRRLPRLLARAEEMPQVVTCCGAAFLNPGREFKIPCHHHVIVSRDDANKTNIIEERLFYATFAVDPDSFLVIRLGKLME